MGIDIFGTEKCKLTFGLKYINIDDHAVYMLYIVICKKLTIFSRLSLAKFVFIPCL